MQLFNSDNGNQLSAGLLALLCALPIAAAVFYIHAVWPDDVETAVMIVGGLFAVLALLPLLAYLAKKRDQAKPREAALIVIAAVGVLLAACYFFQTSFYVFFPADIFIWSEGDFVNDIVKFRQSYPIFTAEVNNESFPYTPGTQILTYLLAAAAGFPDSIPAYRSLQVAYTLLSTIVAFLCCRRLAAIVLTDAPKALGSPLFGVVWLTGLFLIATNSMTNPFNHLLHNDALAQLVTITAYWLLIEYEATRDHRILWLMVLIPTVGFWVKQSLVIWAVLYPAYLVVFDRSRSLRQIIGFGAASFGGVFVSIAVGYLIWQEHFTYWVFTVLEAHGVSLLRSFRHLLDVWVYFAAGLAGGLVLMRSAGRLKKLLGLWIVWLFVISVETYTSGVAWMLNHIGPGSLIAGVWFWTAFAVVWSRVPDATIKTADAFDWLRAGVAATVVCLLFNGFGGFRVPVQPFDRQDAMRYVAEIESEFDVQPRQNVLLDVGTWVYLPDGIVMKDRAPSIGERGYSQSGDFSGILRRFEQRHYQKILVRNLHSSDFWYDHELWSKSSRIRATLLKNYKEAGRIKQVRNATPAKTRYAFSEITVMIPRSK